MNLASYVELAHRAGASDLHLEPGRPATLRVDGRLSARGAALTNEGLIDALRAVLDAEAWRSFVSARSIDLAIDIAAVRCRINAFHTMRGIGIALRLLSKGVPSLDELNLHPRIAELARATHGLILVSGPTGSGKSTTLAALLREIDKGEPRHVITLEHPIEYVHSTSKSLVRQREIGSDTSSFAKGLEDAMREDPDVILVGELRDVDTMRLTLDAAETGHLVLSTVHSGSVAEALARICHAFPSEIQPLVCAQVADCLVAVVAQTLRRHDDLDFRVPECEILRASTPVRSLVRKGDFFRLETVFQTGASDGQWTRERYRKWLESKDHFVRPGAKRMPGQQSSADTEDMPTSMHAAPYVAPTRRRIAKHQPGQDEVPAAPPRPLPSKRDDDEAAGPDDVIVIDAPTGTLSDILEELDDV